MKIILYQVALVNIWRRLPQLVWKGERVFTDGIYILHINTLERGIKRYERINKMSVTKEEQEVENRKQRTGKS